MDLEEFLAGLRVLAVDDDHVCLKILEMQLRHCKYNGECLLCFYFFRGHISILIEALQ